MGFFSRHAAPAPAPRVEPRLAPSEARGVTFEPGPGWGGLAALSAGSGAVSPALAETLATVTACTDALANGIAALPARVYRTGQDGRRELTNNPIARLIAAPTRNMTWPDWASWAVASLVLRGNVLAAIERDNAGRPIVLHPLAWDGCGVDVLPSGRLRYTVNGRTYLEGDVLHIRDRMDGPYVGVSRLARAGAAVSNAIELQRYSAGTWANGATPKVAVTLPANITPDGLNRMRAQFDELHAGTSNAGRTAFIGNGQTATVLSVSPENAEVLASRRFSVTEICRLMNVPPPIVQDYSNNTFTNAAQASLWFATNSLAPIARKIEAEFSRSVFSDPNYHMEIDLSGLLRGDYATRWGTNVAAVSGGLLTPNEVREAEGWGAVEGGDSLRLPAGAAPAG